MLLSPNMFKMLWTCLRWEHYHRKHTHVWVNGKEREVTSGQSYWSQVRRRRKGTDQKQRQRKTTWLSTPDLLPVSYHPEVLTGGICSFLGEILFSGGIFGFHVSSDLGTGWMLPWSCPPMPVSLSELSASFWWEKRDESWQGGRLEDVDRNDARWEDERRRTYSCHGLRKYHGPVGKSYIVLTRA